MSSKNIDTAVLMMAGAGTRDQPHSFDRPNTFGEVGMYRPFDVITEGLWEAGLRRLVIVVRDYDLLPGINMGEIYARRSLRRSGHFEAGNIHFIVQPSHSYGTAASVAAASDILKKLQVPGFAVLNSDGFTLGPRQHKGDTHIRSAWDLGRALKARDKENAEHVLVTASIPRQADGKYAYGIVRHQPGDGRVLEIIEGAHSDTLPHFMSKSGQTTLDANAGIYVFDSSILPILDDYMTKSLDEIGRPEYWLTDMIALATGKGQKTVSVEAEGEFLDCATREKRDQAQQKLIAAGIPLYKK